MKDYYDIYLICNKDLYNINKEHFIDAVQKIFAKRNFIPNFEEDMENLKKMKYYK